jgi:hypothetical protein
MISSLHLWFPATLLLKYTPKFKFSQAEDRQHLPPKQWKTYYITWCKNPEDHHLSNTHHENLKTYVSNLFSVFDSYEIFDCHILQNMLICELPKSILILSVSPEQEHATVGLVHIMNIFMNARALYTF